MKPQTPEPHRLDVAAVASRSASLGGEFPLASLARLSESSGRAADVQGAVTWQVEGSQTARAGQAPERWLHLRAQARIERTCQRCLNPVQLDLSIDQRLRFVESEDEAARLDAELEEDVLPLQPSIDLAELIEDELLLALPLIPKHDRCPELWPGLRTTENPEAKQNDPSENPFAVLAALKRPPTGHDG